MAGRKKESPLQKAVEKILKKKGMDYNVWKREVINKKKLAVMSDEDKEWTERTIEEASLNLLMNEVVDDSYESKAVTNTVHSELKTN